MTKIWEHGDIAKKEVRGGKKLEQSQSELTG